jgi:hypothetical protein
MSLRPAAIRVSDRSVSRTTCYLVARSAIASARFGDELAAAACSYTLTSAPAGRSASAADRPPMPPPTITTRTKTASESTRFL